MTYLKEIVDVVPYQNTLGTENLLHWLQIKGYRTDWNQLFEVEIFKDEAGEWGWFSASFEPNEQEIDEELTSLKVPLNQEDWDALFEELIVHPKVRLHTLF